MEHRRSGPSEPPFTDTTDAEDAAAVVAERIEDYLDHLCAPLLGVVAYRRRQELRSEVRGHLEMLADEYRAEGMTALAAVETALAEYGPPLLCGEELAQAFSQQGAPPVAAAGEQAAPPAATVTTGIPGPLLRTGRPTLLAFACFGGALLACEVLVQAVFGLPRMLHLLMPLVVAATLAPVAAGLAVGALTPSRAAAGTLRAFAVLVPQAALSGLFLAPHRAGVLFALLVLAYWLPMGLLSAVCGESVARYCRMRRVWRESHAATAASAPEPPETSGSPASLTI